MTCYQCATELKEFPPHLHYLQLGLSEEVEKVNPICPSCGSLNIPQDHTYSVAWFSFHPSITYLMTLEEYHRNAKTPNRVM